MKGMHSKTCLPENVCKFLFHCYTCAYVASGSTVVDVVVRERAASSMPKEQEKVRTLICLREGSFTLLGGAHFWSLHPPPALNISSPTLGMLPFRRTHL
ncbi:hypothetical protein T4A_1756 [Trichinella pseudospiralis]|uniref:Uncharacterized protein n=1 Tax=Trichinella pseudospiralis TaxID=6337 RepID=A0A0V1EEW8_TRIPS|nr:hypothetical protein T4A_1756 [Trichinella pseudospiralis]